MFRKFFIACCIDIDVNNHEQSSSHKSSDQRTPVNLSALSGHNTYVDISVSRSDHD